MSEIAGERIRDHLSKVLASREFESSERLCRFLRFTVDAVLAGQQDQIKEYLIGKEVFDRNSDYDPRLDPIVRVEARRLRKKLEDYYAGAGSSDDLRITLPKGSYVPTVEAVELAPDPSVRATPTRRKWIIVAGLGGVALAGLAAAVRLSHTPPPSLAVLPARWIWPSEDFPEISHDEDLAERIAANLANQHRLQVTPWPSVQRFKGQKLTTRRLADELKITRTLIVAVRVESDGFRVTSYLIDAKLDRKLKVSDQRSYSLHAPADRERAAAEIAASFANVE